MLKVSREYFFVSFVFDVKITEKKKKNVFGFGITRLAYVRPAMDAMYVFCFPVQALLKEQPADPTAFLCKQLTDWDQATTGGAFGVSGGS